MQNTIEKFYKAFSNLDAETMASCYHNEIVFQDPAFGLLEGEQARNMWRMLCSSQTKETFTVDFNTISVNGNFGFAHWEAHYLFSKTGRKVHNKIDARFEFKEGLIVKHTDDFNLHAWAKQALGFKGILLGGTKFFQRKLNAQTHAMLHTFEAKHS